MFSKYRMPAIVETLYHTGYIYRYILIFNGEILRQFCACVCVCARACMPDCVWETTEIILCIKEIGRNSRKILRRKTTYQKSAV